ncbi:MAG TPA: CAP domain-containing protein [Pyrinomonadaceae bacterium]|nr:CAP domain-containing protein [Pyrinomonadaceae bacterium]
MALNRFALDRRSFLKAATPLALGLPVLVRSQTFIEKGRWSEEQVPVARAELLKLVNAERASAGLSQLQLDDLACKVASGHAREMADLGFFSHWNSVGYTPFYRYGLVGGVDGLQENVSSAEDIESLTPYRIMNDLRDMHQIMHDEVPPEDGHRKTILFPYHTHVGFGIALQNRSLRLDELYLARYIEFDPFINQAKPKSTVILSGRLINPAHFINNIDVCFERFPEPRSLEWLKGKQASVTLPDIYARLRPRAPEGLTYPDGGNGDFEWNRKGKFRVRVSLSKSEPGIYTVVFWVRRVPADKGFSGAQVCILSKES